MPSPPTAAPPAVRTYGLTKRFDTTLAVDGVDLEVCPGEVRGLLGPNGAGKTTLLRMLFGLVTPDAGSVDVFGQPLHGPDHPALEGVAGFVEDPTSTRISQGARTWNCSLSWTAAALGSGSTASLSGWICSAAAATR